MSLSYERIRQAAADYIAARQAQTPRFPDRCPEHADVAVPGNCGDCADTRKARAAQPRLSLVEPETQRCLIHMEPDVNHCRGCRADEIAVDDDAARRRGA